MVGFRFFILYSKNCFLFSFPKCIIWQSVISIWKYFLKESSHDKFIKIDFVILVYISNT